MANIIISPSRYIQGKGEIRNIYERVKGLGKNFFIIISKNLLNRLGNTIKRDFRNKNCSINFEIFNGECTKEEIDKLRANARAKGCDCIIGIGGGKSLDTSKAVSYYEKLPLVVIPTIASTDAPCSALSVIYTNDGEFDSYLFLPQNPNIVLVDTDVISNAPVRLLVSGMGDALATYFEARACKRSNALSCASGNITNAAMELAKLCYDTLQSDGLKAKLAVENHVCTKAVENIIEANTYLSGIGFESGGLAGAHAIHNGFTVLHECHNFYHGEKVAFGTLVQLVLENAPIDEIQEVIYFCMNLGLPTTLADLNLQEATEDQIMKVAAVASSEDDTIHNMPFPVTAKDVYEAIIGADSLGRFYKCAE